ncbi:acyltransferase family protein [Agrobacterium sp. AGB01]|uniref:acyltransferase family protein n=1 Tax=Agrobacterium sp. AGB01 TaxID=2769302 RepID=UPI00178391B6|nr:acyltransferase family protein [Agrobacterium sp. AGB01]MBD9390419.1 acyltransferase family protein [Agrobacterium sp. AGB01]
MAEMGSYKGDDLFQLAEMWILPHSGLWFIWALAIFFVVAKAVKSVPAVTLVVSFLLAALTWGSIISPENFAYRNVLTYLFFFLLGCFQGQRLRELVTDRPIITVAVAFAGFVFIKYFALRLAAGNLIAVGLLRTSLSIVGLVLGCSLSLGLTKISLLKSTMLYIGRNTTAIYVTHIFVVAILAAAFSSMLSPQMPWPLLVSPMIVISSVGLSIAAKEFAERVGLAWVYRTPELPVRKTRGVAPSA